MALLVGSIGRIPVGTFLLNEKSYSTRNCVENRGVKWCQPCVIPHYPGLFID